MHTSQKIYQSLMNKDLSTPMIGAYLETNAQEMLDFIRSKLMTPDSDMQVIYYLYSRIIEAGHSPFSIPIVWHRDFEKTVTTLRCVPEDDLSYSLVRDHIFHKSYLFAGTSISETLQHALTMLSVNPMASPLWCMITQAIMECAPHDKKRDLCIESLEPSCSKGEFISHVLKQSALNY
jgi:hypothetical protein